MTRQRRPPTAAAAPAVATAWPGSAKAKCVPTPLERLESGLLRSSPEAAVTKAGTMMPDTLDVERTDDVADDVDRDSAASDPNAGAPGRVQPRVTDPALLCAILLLRRALRAMEPVGPNLRDAMMVILEIPAATWTDLAAIAWRRIVAGDLAPGALEDRDVARGEWPRRSRPRWLLVARDGSEKSHKPENGNKVVAWAACTGVPVVGISSDPERLLPEALVRAADLRLTLPRPDIDVLRKVARILTGGSPRAALGTDFANGAGAATPDSLRLARRPDQTADAWLDRLADLLATNSTPSHGITLGELAGMDAVVGWGEALARDLAGYKAGQIGWSAVDRGALLAGPPGVGKTTAARAIAGTCRVPLIVTGYAAWQAHGDGHMGNVIQAIRGVFDRARAMAPCVLFIDELDSIRSRSRDAHWDDWWTAIINCLLEQLDGLSGREGVVVIGATNHAAVIDPAIVRAGRLDRVIRIPLPNAAALTGILRFHLKQDLVGADLQPFAESLEALGGTGADVEKVVRGGRRRARHACRAMTAADLAAEIGAPQTLPPELQRRHAVHEAGHAVVACLLTPGSLRQVSIRAKGNVSGWTSLRRDMDAMTRDRIEILMRTLLAGRAAEDVILGMPSAGAGGSEDSDLARANWLAANTVLSFGLGRGLGALRWRLAPDERLPAALPDHAEAEISDMLADAYDAAVTMIRTHRLAVSALADRLIDAVEVDGREAEALLHNLGVVSDRGKNPAGPDQVVGVLS